MSQLGALCCACGVLGHLAPVHRCAHPVCCVACPVTWTTWHVFTGVLARCGVFCVQGPRPLGSCSPVCPLGVLCSLCDYLDHLAPVDRCARSVRSVMCAAYWATWLLFTGVFARCVVLRVRCPGPLGSCLPVCLPVVLWCGPGSLGTCLLVCSLGALCSVIDVLARCVVFFVQCPGLLGSCSPVCPLGVLCCFCGYLCHLAPVDQCARSVRCVMCPALWATWLLFTGVLVPCVALHLQCQGPLGSCSLVCPLGALR